MLRINSNGSRWNGQEPDSVDNLTEVLGKEPLDPRFLNCGRFIIPLGNGAIRFFGNFYRLSHVFSIDTDEPEVIGRLTAAICDNMASAEFRELSQRVERVRDAAFRLLEFAQDQERMWGAAITADEGIDGAEAVDYLTVLVTDARRVISKATGGDPMPFVAGERLLEALYTAQRGLAEAMQPHLVPGLRNEYDIVKSAIAEAEAVRGGVDHGKS